MSKTYTTKKGSVLPLMQLKGKDYMMVAYRLAWLNDDVDRFTISTDIVVLDDEKATVKTTLNIYDNDGNTIKTASATKTEHKKDFNDFLEKAETGSLGRALSMTGFGTQYALADLDEGSRIVDTPLSPIEQTPVVDKPVSSFKKRVKKEEVVADATTKESAEPVATTPVVAGGWE